MATGPIFAHAEHLKESAKVRKSHSRFLSISFFQNANASKVQVTILNNEGCPKFQVFQPYTFLQFQRQVTFSGLVVRSKPLILKIVQLEIALYLLWMMKNCTREMLPTWGQNGTRVSDPPDSRMRWNFAKSLCQTSSYWTRWEVQKTGRWNSINRGRTWTKRAGEGLFALKLWARAQRWVCRVDMPDHVLQFPQQSFSVMAMEIMRQFCSVRLFPVQFPHTTDPQSMEMLMLIGGCQTISVVGRVASKNWWCNMMLTVPWWRDTFPNLFSQIWPQLLNSVLFSTTVPEQLLDSFPAQGHMYGRTRLKQSFAFFPFQAQGIPSRHGLGAIWMVLFWVHVCGDSWFHRGMGVKQQSVSLLRWSTLPFTKFLVGYSPPPNCAHNTHYHVWTLSLFVFPALSCYSQSTFTAWYSVLQHKYSSNLSVKGVELQTCLNQWTCEVAMEAWLVCASRPARFCNGNIWWWSFGAQCDFVSPWSPHNNTVQANKLWHLPSKNHCFPQTGGLLELRLVFSSWQAGSPCLHAGTMCAWSTCSTVPRARWPLVSCFGSEMKCEDKLVYFPTPACVTFHCFLVSTSIQRRL